MNMTPNHPSGGGGGKRRRRRGRRPHGPRPQQGTPHNGPTIPQHREHRGRSGGSFTGPMDHSYRLNQGNGQPQGGRRSRPGFGYAPPRQFAHQELEPLPVREDAAPRIFAVVDDLFFVAKIQEVSRKLNVKVEFLKSETEVLDRVAGNGVTPSLIILDLNNAAAKPLSTLPKLRAKFPKGTTIIGFLSHIQGDLKIKALDAGADMVLPRSAFSQNLPQLLRRHGAPEDFEGVE